MANSDLRSQLKATPIKKLKKKVDEDNELIGAGNSEYLNLEDGKSTKIRLFPAHPGFENFYIPKKCYWLTITRRDGEKGRVTVNDSKLHGGTKMDLVEEYTKMAKRVCSGETAKLEAISGQKDSLNPSYSWMSYASKVTAEEALHPMLWEFKKMVRDAMNKLAFSEDEDDAIEIDPFTDPDDGLPILVKYMKNPNRKKGELYYDVSFPKKAAARPLTDEEIEAFMKLKPLAEAIPKYGMQDFDKALEGLQNFDEENEIGLFENDDWLEKIEEVKAQYEETEEQEKPKTKKVVKKSSKVEDDEEEATKPAKKTAKKAVVVEEEEEEEEGEEEESCVNADEFTDMDRNELKRYIKAEELEVTVKKSMTDDDIREAIREARIDSDGEETEEEESEEEPEEEEKPKAKVSLADIKSKLKKK